jgi:FMN-dependent NADH-azoreductase
MKILLHIDSSPRTQRSHSRRLTAQFARAWRSANPDGTVVHRELGLTPVPLVSEDWIAAAFSSPADHTSAQRAAIAVSDELIDELVAADEVVIGAPMYNFGVTAALKAWIDQVVRVGRTVQYPSYAGLVKGKKVTIITTRGLGFGPGEPMAQFDAQVPYLKQILGFIGITDVSVVYADSLAGSDEARQSSLNKALAEIEELASN